MIVFVETKKTPYVAKMDIKGISERNAHPYAQQVYRLKKDRYTEKFITGFELPNDSDIDTILKSPTNSYYDIALERKKIESSLGISLDGSTDNEFLLNFSVCLTPLQVANTPDSGKLKLDTDRPSDLFTYRALTANGIVAPNKESLDVYKYLKTNYYFSNPIEAQSKKKGVAKLKNQISSKLTQHENNPVWLLSVSEALGLVSSPGLTEDTLYSQLSDYKDNLRLESDIQKAHKIFNTDIIDLIPNFIVSAGIKYDVIKRDKDGNYVYDMIILGRDKAQILKFVNLAANNNLFFEIKDAIFKKFGLKIKNKD